MRMNEVREIGQHLALVLNRNKASLFQFTVMFRTPGCAHGGKCFLVRFRPAVTEDRHHEGVPEYGFERTPLSSDKFVCRVSPAAISLAATFCAAPPFKF